MRAILFAMASLAVLGCQGDEASSSAPEVTLQLVAQYGSRDGQLALQTIQGLSADPSGERLYVTQRGVASVLVLSSSGDSLQTLGAPGEGPGEFRFPGTAHVWHDTIWVPDYIGQVTAFSPSGEYLTEITLSQVRFPGATASPTVVGMLEGGNLLVEGGISIGRAAAGEQSAVPLARVTRSGNLIGSVAQRIIAGGFVRLPVPSGGVMLGPHPTASWDLTCLDPLGRWFVTAAQDVGGSREPSIRVAWVSAVGDTLQSVSLALPAVSSGAAQVAWRAEFAESFDLTIGEVQQLGESIEWPASMPAKSMTCDHEARTWLQLPHASPDSATWTLLGSSGEVIGTTTLAAPVNIKAAVGDQVWGWVPGAYDEPYILRFRLSDLDGLGRSAVP